ncbi:MAG TPA: T9SS type A sorting domain-containing protein [Paludibacteraceae bacterium]|nr:T9SS type A sorting domain-containing protein [Paludibacteraceae bacterium]
MKKILLSLLFLIFCIGIYSQDKTYIIKIESLSLNSVVLSWQRADGTSEKDTTHDYTLYYCEYGPKGFERGKGVIGLTAWAGNIINNLIPGTEYSFFIRKETVPADSSVWFEEYNFKTLSCNNSISNIKTIMQYANGINIKDLIDVHISFDALANSFELEYGPKGFERGSGTIMSNYYNGFSIGNANLQSNTEYDFYIRGKCGGVYGDWSGKSSFATTNVFHYAGSEAFDVAFEHITNKSARVNWSRIVPGYASRSYKIEYGPKGFERGKGQTQNPILNIADLDGLEEDTEYSLFIRSYGTASTDSVWFIEHTFKTLPCNTEISGVKSSEVWTTCYCGDGAIVIEWNDLADSYELEYGLKDFKQGEGNLIQTDNSYVNILPNLGGLNYDFYIRAKCNGEFGNWTTKNSFTSSQIYYDIKNVQTSNFEIFPNPVGDILNIKLNSVFDISSVTVSVFDLIGSVRYKSEYKDNYNLSSLPAGTYIIRVKDKQLSESIIIQKK